MTIYNQNVEIPAGDSGLIRATVWNLDKTPSTLLDLTGATIEWIVRKVLPPRSSIIKLTEQDAELTVTGVGTFEIELLPKFTRGKVGKYEHQCRITIPSGETSTVFEGDFQVLRSLF